MLILYFKKQIIRMRNKIFNFFLFSRIIFSFNDKKLITIAASFEKFTKSL